MDASIELLKELTLANAVPGFEGPVRAIMERELSPLGGTIERDRQGSLIWEHPAQHRENHIPLRLVLDCHLDEVGFMVHSITPQGFLSFVMLGGWWPHQILGQRVTVLTEQGELEGIIGAAPPRKRELVLEIEDMVIDIGASSRDEAMEWGVVPGQPVAPVSPFRQLRNEKLFVGKAFDNRVGCALCIEAARRCAGNHPNDLLVTGCVQEEVGVRGAATAMAMARPDVAVVLEGPPADDNPKTNRDESQGRLGGGVQIRLYDPSTIINPSLAKLAVALAEREGIPYQLAVRRAGGTDAREISRYGHGVPVIVLGVPVRYAHAHAGMINIDDYRAALDLTCALVDALEVSRTKGLLGIVNE